jgi:alanyl-tRNA synthetase
METFITIVYKDLCKKYNIFFDTKKLTLRPYDNSTLFCIAGMQQFSEYISNPEKAPTKTIANIQPCLRINDLNDINDGTHLLYFNMIGLFSFNEWNIEKSIQFFLEFMNELEINLSYVTLHPDKKEWSKFYKNIEIRYDNNCKWSHGGIEGYCTEFFVNINNEDVEIGNIVNPNNNCIDVGFGLERLNYAILSNKYSEEEVLENTILEIINSGYVPSNKKQGYVLRKLIRIAIKKNIIIDNSIFLKEKLMYDHAIKTYIQNKNKSKFKNKSKEWWIDTFGIDPNEIL